MQLLLYTISGQEWYWVAHSRFLIDKKKEKPREERNCLSSMTRNAVILCLGVYCPADNGFPMGPYTTTRGYYGYNEVQSHPYLFLGVQSFFNTIISGFGDLEQWHPVEPPQCQQLWLDHCGWWLLQGALHVPEWILVVIRWSRICGLEGMLSLP